MGNLYVVGQVGQPHVKVGMTTRCVTKRIGDWDTGSPHHWQINLDLQVMCSTPELKALEKAVHKNLQAYHRRLEWFTAEPATVLAAIGSALATSDPEVDKYEVKVWRLSPEYSQAAEYEGIHGIGTNLHCAYEDFELPYQQLTGDIAC